MDHLKNSKSLSNERGQRKGCNEANKCKTYGLYDVGVWTGATAEHINYQTVSTQPSSTQKCQSICDSVSDCGVKTQKKWSSSGVVSTSEVFFKK